MWQKIELEKINFDDANKNLKTELSTEYKKITYKAKNQESVDIYLYVQLFFMAILILTSFILKNGSETTYLTAKNTYTEFFEQEYASNNTFSYDSFFSKLQNEIQIQYNELMQTIASVSGKGSANGVYPDNVSLARYKLETKGVVPVEGYISSEFGVRKNPFNSKQKEFHTGLDIAAAKGTFIKSAFDGTVIKATYSETAGNYITVQHNDGLVTLYAHNQFSFVKEGDIVLAGQTIATVGDTGKVTGAHLHFEVIIDGIKYNPKYAINI